VGLALLCQTKKDSQLSLTALIIYTN